MPRAILILLLALAWPAATAAQPAAAPPARVAQARIARITTPVATLRGVQVRLAWAPGAAAGDLQLQAAAVDAPDLGYHFRDLHWRCPLQRAGAHGWRCEGEVRKGRGAPLRLAVAFDDAGLRGALRGQGGALTVVRPAASPDDTAIDLARVPLAWAQSLLALAWPEAQLKGGSLDGKLRVHAPTGQPLQVDGQLALAGAALDTPDATIAAQDLGGRFDIHYATTPALSTFTVDGELRAGEFLAGNAYVALPASAVAVHAEGRKPQGAGWTLPAFSWRDGDVLRADGEAAFTAAGGLDALDIALHGTDMAPLRERYLSGWLGLAGLPDLALAGAFDASARIARGTLQRADATLHSVDIADGAGRFRFAGLDGDVRFSADAAVDGMPVDSTLRWRDGQLYGLDFGGAALPLRSDAGELRLREPVTVAAFGGRLRFDGLVLRPPAAGEGLRMKFGLGIDRLDIGMLAKALGWPAFEGELSGTIPDASYDGERLAFDGGLDMQLFGGNVRVSQLSLERPFGVAPSLGADLAIEDLDLHAVTGVFGFGSIDGKLDGRIDGLRLVDWTATAFDGELHTDAAAARRAHVRQRISQRAVQNISSVGDASFATSLQGRLIAFFDDFGYANIGISCRLANEVCEMAGLHPAASTRGFFGVGAAPDTGGSGPGFTIVEGAGLPRLAVVGYNHLVDWPTLLERLAAVGKGEVKPVVQ